MDWLVDTSVLVRTIHTGNPQQQFAIDALAALRTQNEPSAFFRKPYRILGRVSNEIPQPVSTDLLVKRETPFFRGFAALFAEKLRFSVGQNSSCG